MIYGLTIQMIGKAFDFRCPECALLVGQTKLIREDGPPINVYCGNHPENFGQWTTVQDMEREKLELAKRIGLA